LNQRDDTIAELLQQCLQYSQQLTLVQDIQPHEDHKEQISELETANPQLEVVLREDIDHLEHKTEYYDGTIWELDRRSSIGSPDDKGRKR
jgi:hypothetical protein